MHRVKLIIANSLAPIPKLLTIGKRHYKRLAECKLGMIQLNQALGICKSNEKLKYDKLFDLQMNLKYDIDQMIELLDKHIKKEPYIPSDLENELLLPLSELLKDTPFYGEVIVNNTDYRIYEYLLTIY